MRANPISKLIIFVLILVLMSNFVFSVVGDNTAVMTQINERLEMNKAEIIKAIRDAMTQNQNTTSSFIDQNFQTLDQRLQDFLKASKRDIALIMVAGFLIGFALSQIIRLTIERARRRSLIKRGMELEMVVEKLEKEAVQLFIKVRQLQDLDHKYSHNLKKLTQKEPLITLKMMLFGVITLLLGLVLAILFKVKF